jgi:hypothetical protein
LLDLISTEQHAGLRIEIRYDPDRPDPRREFENLGTIVGWKHRRLLLGDRQADAQEQTPRQHVGRLRQEGARIVLPVYYSSHGPQCALAIGEDEDPESIARSSGVIYVTAKKLRAEYGTPITSKALATATRVLAGEIAEYSAYLNGSVYGFIVTDADRCELEDEWGFYDLAECESDARAAADRCAETQASEKQEAYEMACRDIQTVAA